MDYGKIMVLMSDPTGTVPADADLSCTAEELLHAAKKADVDYRGIGFPWEVTVTVRVPKAYIESVREAGVKEVSEGLAAMFNAEDFFENLSERLKAAKKAEIQRRIEELNEQLRELDEPVRLTRTV